jgi:fructose-1,6-bisphosphatase I
MQKSVVTLTDYLLEERKKNKHDLVILLHQIEDVGKILASHVKASGLVDILGKTGQKNSFGEEVQKLDEFANNLLTTTLLNGGQVHAIVSEEESEARYATKPNDGDYIVYFDPLDGSSNIDTNCPIGTIFGIYHKKNGLLQPGREQIAAGYILYGASVMFVYSTGNGVNGFTLDPAMGSFLLSHPNITIPTEGKIYSINEGYTDTFSPNVRSYLQKVKSDGAGLRYVGSMVADLHRTLLKGGIFLYPSTTSKPEGK